jgi:hypothetical protein
MSMVKWCRTGEIGFMIKNVKFGIKNNKLYFYMIYRY